MNGAELTQIMDFVVDGGISRTECIVFMSLIVELPFYAKEVNGMSNAYNVLKRFEWKQRAEYTSMWLL